MNLSPRTTALTAALATATTLLVSAAPAAATHGCRTSTSKGARIVAQSREAVFFSKQRKTKFGTAPVYYGCLFGVGTTHQLTELQASDQLIVRNAQLAGRYVAFSQAIETTFVDEGIQDVILVYDLKTGKEERVIDDVATGDPPGTVPRDTVHAIALKRNASIGWIATPSRPEAQKTFQVHKIDNELDDKRSQVDAGTDIEPGSLGLSDDRQTLYWLRGAAPRSVSLR